jgi:hypothetical protein
MKQKKESPDRLREPMQGQNDLSTCVCGGKCTELLSKRQRKVFDLLLSGKQSAADITIQLGYSDPRSYVRELREKGINVQDEWLQREDVRFKRYWINETPLKSKVNNIHTVGEVMQSSFRDLFERDHYD